MTVPSLEVVPDASPQDRWQLSLAGEWTCALDPDAVGEQEAWFRHGVANGDDTSSATPSASSTTPVILPGSIQHQGLGDEIALDTPWTGSIVDRSFFTDERYAPYRRPGNIAVPFWLQPRRYYRGAAWFTRTVEIPPEWAGRRVRLSLERVHWESTVWLDGERAGCADSLCTPHEVDLGRLAPGPHVLTVRIDNRTVVDVGPNAHSVSDHTQGNWNGAIGALTLTALPDVVISRVRTFPDVAARRVEVRVDLAGTTAGTGRGVVRATARLVSPGGVASPSANAPDGEASPSASTPPSTPGSPSPDGATAASPSATTATTATAEASFDEVYEVDLRERGLTASRAGVDLVLDLGPDARTWDEFDPALYELTVELSTRVGDVEHTDTHRTRFGLREIAVRAGRLEINGRPAFLRGTLECAVFPLTGYPPTDVAAWRRIVAVCRAHGLNLIRFHSWCPPEAAFVAADEAGMYLQVEGPLWANQGAAIGEGRPVDAFLHAETRRILDTFGNHPSFVVMAHGNEPAGRDVELLGGWLRWCQRLDPRRLYTSAAGWPAIEENDLDNVPDPRAHQWGDGLASRLNARPPETTTDYRDAVAASPRPVVSHEIGQWCAYPDLAERARYTGLMRPRNFDVFADFLAQAGLADLAPDLLRVSGRLQTLCYKEEVESALRTEGLGGFHLLGLSDFPGQGTATVGVLNAFWESKGYCSPEEFSRFCGPTVPLVLLPQRVWTAGEDLTFDVVIAHFGAAPLRARVTWSLRDDAGGVVHDGEVADGVHVALGNGNRLGPVTVPIAARARAERLTLWLTVTAEDGSVRENDWPLWFLPAPTATAALPATSSLPVTPGSPEASGSAGPGGVTPALPPAERATRAAPSCVVGTHEVAEAIAAAEAGAAVLLELLSASIGNDVALGFTPVFWNTAWTSGQAPHTLGLLIDAAHPVFEDFPTQDHTDWLWWDLLHGARAMLADGLPPTLTPIVRPIDTWFSARPLTALFEARLGAGRIVVTSLALGADRPASAHLRRGVLAHLGRADRVPAARITAQELRSVLR
ncbi:MAG TPA: glycoside hydrolase [Micrococcales bacterium]|uniref:glycoside hydrolase n=1 Tax=Miniimonas arenae TaxID=676201 RepID=UPI000EC11864|nr:glycoside hydrolase [Miniimonas arenae]HCX84889.1 glycoside hydrolase [Micrococcales bacterium]